MTSAILRVVAGALGMAILAAGAYVAYARHRYAAPRAKDRPARDPGSTRRIGGFDLHVRVVGQRTARTPVMVLHGGPGHSHLSVKQGMDFLGQDRLVVEYDQRGSGLSECRAGSHHYTAEQLVAEIDEVRCEVLGTERMILVGHSAGGALAQRYAVAHPERVERLILVGSTLANAGQSPGWLWRMAGPALYSAQLGFPPGDADAADEWFAERIRPDDVARLHDPSRTHIIDGSGPNTFSTWLAVSQSLAGSPLASDLARLDIPTLIISGAADSAHTGPRAARQLQALIPGAQLAEIPASGHWPFAENPTAFESAVRGFLAQAAPTTSESPSGGATSS